MLFCEYFYTINSCSQFLKSSNYFSEIRIRQKKKIDIFLETLLYMYVNYETGNFTYLSLSSAQYIRFK